MNIKGMHFQGRARGFHVEIIGLLREVLIKTPDRELWIGRTRADGYPLGIASGITYTDTHRTSARYFLGFFLISSTRMVSTRAPQAA